MHPKCELLNEDEKRLKFCDHLIINGWFLSFYYDKIFARINTRKEMDLSLQAIRKEYLSNHIQYGGVSQTLHDEMISYMKTVYTEVCVTTLEQKLISIDHITSIRGLSNQLDELNIKITTLSREYILLLNELREVGRGLYKSNYVVPLLYPNEDYSFFIYLTRNLISQDLPPEENYKRMLHAVSQNPALKIVLSTLMNPVTKRAYLYNSIEMSKINLLFLGTLVVKLESLWNRFTQA